MKPVVSHPSAPRRSSMARRPTPRIEALEDRSLPSTFTVLNLNNSGAGSLRQAIADANAHSGADTIRFSGGLRGTITLTSTLYVTDDLTILGPGTDKVAVSGGNAARAFGVLPAALAGNPFVTPTAAQVATSPEVTITELTVAGGRATNALGFDPADPGNPGFSFGGGLYNLGGTVHLDQVRMVGNAASGVVTAGGAVANEFGGTLTVARSSFEGNTSGGFLIGVGGAITSDLGPTADAGPTGPPTLTVDRSSFVGNRALAQLGYIAGVGFTGLGGGGAILSLTGALTISRSEFVGNSAQGGVGSNPGAASGGPGFGGAVLTGDASPFGIRDATMDVRDSTFSGNTATGGSGGAAGVPGGEAAGGAVAVSNGTDAALRDNTFSANAATGGSGGANADGGRATGGAVAGFAGANVALLRNALRENAAEGGAGPGAGIGGTGRGGGLGLGVVDLAGFYPTAPTGTVFRDLFQDNVAGGVGGGIYNAGGLTIEQATVKDNRAVGDPDVAVPAAVPIYYLAGGAAGGRIANFGTLAVSGSTIRGNLARGADLSTGGAFASGDPDFPGYAGGGGLYNFNVATVTGSQFTGNTAQAGSRCEGPFAGIGIGGGIYNDFMLAVTGSSLSQNRAVGGSDGNVVNPALGFHNGHALGGGVASGSLMPVVGQHAGAAVNVSQSTFDHNQAQGGDNNHVLVTPALADGPNNGYGGGILVYYGGATIHQSTLTHNQALGGAGGGDQNGSLGVGGGVFVFNFFLTVTADVSGCTIEHNDALGGAGTPGGSGGAGLGGGLAATALNSPFSALSCTVTVSSTAVGHNLAQGGEGGNGGDGGDGLGGGLFNDTHSGLSVAASTITHNQAKGGKGKGGGSDGEGVGGGVYNLGTFAFDVFTVIAHNQASTSNDDVLG